MSDVRSAMSDIHGTSTGRQRGGQGTAADYFALLKPRVMSLVIFTALVGHRRRARRHPSLDGAGGAAGDRGRRRRLGRAQYVV